MPDRTADRMLKKFSENMDNRMPEGMSEDVLDRMQKNEK
jgi:muconolactone delta-isomerase